MPFGNSWLYFMNAGVADDRGKEMQEFSFSGSIHVPKKPSVWNRNDGHLTFGETKRPSLKSPSHCFTQFKEGEKIPFFHFVAFVFTWWWWELKMKKMKKNNLFFSEQKSSYEGIFFLLFLRAKKCSPLKTITKKPRNCRLPRKRFAVFGYESQKNSFFFLSSPPQKTHLGIPGQKTATK